MSKCADCDRPLLAPAAVRERAIAWAAAIKDEPADGAAGFACFGLLLMAELLIRCDACAPIRVMTGAELVAAKVGYFPRPAKSRGGS